MPVYQCRPNSTGWAEFYIKKQINGHMISVINQRTDFGVLRLNDLTVISDLKKIFRKNIQ